MCDASVTIGKNVLNMLLSLKTKQSYNMFILFEKEINA